MDLYRHHSIVYPVYDLGVIRGPTCQIRIVWRFIYRPRKSARCIWHGCVFRIHGYHGVRSDFSQRLGRSGLPGERIRWFGVMRDHVDSIRRNEYSVGAIHPVLLSATPSQHPGSME